jgi:hypothetical protein
MYSRLELGKEYSDGDVVVGFYVGPDIKNIYGSSIIGFYLNYLLEYTVLLTVRRMDVLKYTELSRTDLF